MQLFTLGLIRLNIDGTPMIGADGQPIETYNNVDLASYARAWTGLDDTARRGNNDGFFGPVDPMRVSLAINAPRRIWFTLTLLFLNTCRS